MADRKAIPQVRGGRPLRFDVRTSTEIGARFVRLRRRVEYSQADLARRIGLTPARVMQIENGMRFGESPTKPSLAVLRLFEALERRAGLTPEVDEDDDTEERAHP